MDIFRGFDSESIDETTTLLPKETTQTSDGNRTNGSTTELLSNDEEELAICPDMDWTTRMQFFGVLFGLGVLSCVLGSFFFWSPSTFAVLYTVGNICALASTCFLMGPKKQLQRMVDPTRLFSAAFVAIFIVLTLCSALWWQSGVLSVLFCFLQFVALCWYALSYIPYAQETIKRCCVQCV